MPESSCFFLQIDQTTRNLSKIDRIKFETFITIHVHQRDIFDTLVAAHLNFVRYDLREIDSNSNLFFNLVPIERKIDDGLRVGEAVSVLLPAGHGHYRNLHNRRLFRVSERVSRSHGAACHHSADGQVLHHIGAGAEPQHGRMPSG